MSCAAVGQKRLLEQSKIKHAAQRRLAATDGANFFLVISKKRQMARSDTHGQLATPDE